MMGNTSYSLAIKDRDGKYLRYEVSAEVYLYVKQLEAYITHPNDSKLPEFYADRFGWIPTITRPVNNGIKATLVGGPYDTDRCYVLDVHFLIPVTKRVEELPRKMHFYKSFGELRDDFSETFEYQGIIDWPESK